MFLKLKFTVLISFLSIYVFSQENEIFQDLEKKKVTIFGGLESNSQWYLNDNKMQINAGDLTNDEQIRSNNYLLVNGKYGNFSSGIQIESYEPNALLNYNPKFEGTNVGTWYVDYKTNKFQITGGYFYEQFGSGMILRNWEDRAIGINNSIRGVRAKFTPNKNIALTALYGRQRTGFDVSDGDIYGFDSTFGLSEALNLESSDLTFGFSAVGREEEIPYQDVNFKKLTGAISSRLDYSSNSFYSSFEYSLKSNDGILDTKFKLIPDFVKPGNAFLFNFGFAKSGLGVDLTLRRVENMTFLSERIPESYNSDLSSFQVNDKILNFVPALTKQHHFNLANIYVHQAQYRVDFIDAQIMKAGETGGQIDVFYNFKKGSKLGGKYGTKLAVNYASWYNLPGEYGYNPPQYKTNFFGVSQKYFSDFNIEVTKRLNKKVHGSLMYINQYYDQRLISGGYLVKTHIIGVETTIKLKGTQSIRVQGEHMWADHDMENWAGGTLEYNFNSKLSFYAFDLYNYGNPDEKKQTHFYSFGSSYRKGSTRIALNYGRQRGGLVCVGGVCRVVPESKGLSLTLTKSF